jgi:hypothetical protein
VHKAGIASTQEHALRQLPGLADGASDSLDASSLGVKTLMERGRQCLGPASWHYCRWCVSVIHPLSINTFQAAATTAGAAVARQDQQKGVDYVRVEPNC